MSPPRRTSTSILSSKIALAAEPGREGVPAAALTVTPANYGISADLQRQAIQAYHASTSFMDAQVGKLLDALDRLQACRAYGGRLHQRPRLPPGRARALAKAEPVRRVGPGAADRRRAGDEGAGEGLTAARSSTWISTPRLADLCGLPVPADLPGRSFRALLDDPDQPGKEAALTQVRRGGGMAAEGFKGYSLRTERYRYIEWDGGRRGTQLYDHQTDPHELHNLADDPNQAETVNQLEAPPP